MKKKTKAEGITIPDFKLYLQSCHHQDSMVLAQEQTLRSMEQNREPRNGPTRTYGQLIFDKAGMNIQWNKHSLFSKWCWENWTATCRRMNLDHFLTSYRKISSKWMKDLNVRQEAIKLLEEKAGKNLFDLSHSNFLLNTSLKSRDIKAEMTYWDQIGRAHV